MLNEMLKNARIVSVLASFFLKKGDEEWREISPQNIELLDVKKITDIIIIKKDDITKGYLVK